MAFTMSVAFPNQTEVDDAYVYPTNVNIDLINGTASISVRVYKSEAALKDKAPPITAFQLFAKVRQEPKVVTRPDGSTTIFDPDKDKLDFPALFGSLIVQGRGGIDAAVKALIEAKLVREVSPKV